MICPTCHRDFWALFIGWDGVYRCRADRDAMGPAPVVIKVNAAGESYRATAKATSERPYVTRRKKCVGVKKGRK